MNLPWRTLLWAWLAALGLGLVAFLYVYAPSGPHEAVRAFADYVLHGGARTWLLVIGGVLLLVVAVAANFMGGWSGEVESPFPAIPSFPRGAAGAQLIRESLLSLGARLSARLSGSRPDIPGFVDTLLLAAVQFHASDIHLTPREEGTRLALRIHGVLEDLDPIPQTFHTQIVTRLKVLARLTTYQHDRPQDGHFAWQSRGASTDARISVLPTTHGEKVVLRLALSGAEAPDLDALGIPAPMLARLAELLARPQGVLFFTGPTGAGKTTTIYAALGQIKKARGGTTQIVTIEDPIELDLPFLGQTQVNPGVGLTFAEGLRSILRQDPNVIMVGEIRDAETAGIAIRAGMTGHLVLTTVHADSAAGVFNRVIDMNVEPFLVASASLACLSQRLVRTLCPHCREPAAPSMDEARRLQQIHARGKFFAARGCPRCRGTGFVGRTAVFELLVVDQPIRDLINARTPTPGIHDAAVGAGMASLLESALDLARPGTIPLSEALRLAVWK
jgi:general secretion pathway protein E